MNNYRIKNRNNFPEYLQHDNNWYIEDNRGKNIPQKNKSIKKCKEKFCNSLYEVENFLREFSAFSKYIKIYKLLKK